MSRFLLGIVAIVVLGLFIRSALIAAMKEAKPGLKPRKGGPNLPPDRLVCGVCGKEFDPDTTGWICPSCGK